MTHTPGPWIADGAQVHSPGFGHIAECGLAAGKPGAFLEYEECAANARLIAAALNMLAALRAVILSDALRYHADTKSLVMAAIAEAESRS